MTEQSFSLIPFPAPGLPQANITGRIAREKGILAIHYLLSGKIEDVLMPPPSVNPARKDELWKSTCFELFLGITNSPQYWEFNFSPSGEWNVYRMDAYRRIGFREETSIQRLQLEIQNEADGFVLNATVDLNPVFQQSQLLDVGIAAIIQTNDGNATYWALNHSAPYADFHLRESFILALAGQTHLGGQSAPGD